jgi:hypothetical protein
VWRYKDEAWDHGDVKDYTLSGYFSLTVMKNKLILIANSGEMFNVGLNELTSIKSASTGISLNDGIIVENRDTQKILFINQNALSAKKPLIQIIDQFAIPLF